MHFTFHNLIDWENILSILKIKFYFCSVILDTKVFTRKIQRSTGKYVFHFSLHLYMETSLLPW